MKPIQIHPLPAFVTIALLGLLSFAQGRQVHEIHTLTPEQAEILSHMTLLDLNDAYGNPHRTLRIQGVDVQLLAEDGDQYSPLHTANLIIGSNVAPIGSHNLLVGQDLWLIDSFGCFLHGVNSQMFNSINCRSLTSGAWITDGDNDSLLGGRESNIQGYSGGSNVILGGDNNSICAGFGGAIVGGSDNTITSPGWANLLAGGGSNSIGANDSTCLPDGPVFSGCSVVGGVGNRVANDMVTVTGATVTGGSGRDVSGDYDWRAGSLFEDQ